VIHISFNSLSEQMTEKYLKTNTDQNQTASYFCLPAQVTAKPPACQKTYDATDKGHKADKDNRQPDICIDQSQADTDSKRTGRRRRLIAFSKMPLQFHIDFKEDRCMILTGA